MSSKPNESWTLKQWDAFKKEADDSFNSWLYEHRVLAVEWSFNECKTAWLKGSIKK